VGRIGGRPLTRGLARCRAAPSEERGERQRKQQPEAPLAHADQISRSERIPDRHNFVTLLCVVTSERITTLKARTMSQLFTHRKRLHRHSGVQTYVLLQRLGIPYEVERTVCSECRRVLDERPLKRAAA